jgi:hypothetical protein
MHIVCLLCPGTRLADHITIMTANGGDDSPAVAALNQAVEQFGGIAAIREARHHQSSAAHHNTNSSM